MSARRSVMVVDDDEDIREIIAIILSTRGIETILACDGLDALELVRANGPPALILLDLMMPRMDGKELARELRADPETAHTPIVVMSGNSEARATAAAIGDCAWLPKPVGLEDLLAVVRRFLTV
ncbi:MAG: response regulator [Polyangiaceae bacterium]